MNVLRMLCLTLSCLYILSGFAVGEDLVVNGSITATREADGIFGINLERTGSNGDHNTWRIWNMAGSYGNDFEISQYPLDQIHPNSGADDCCIKRFEIRDNGDTILAPEGGNIGIGVTNPGYKLHVNGTAKVTGTLYADSHAVVGGNLRVGNVTNTDEGIAGYGRKLLFSGGSDWGWTSENSDPLWIARYNVANDVSELRVNIGDGPVASDKFSIGTSHGIWHPKFTVQANGFVGIGTTTPQSTLAVNGTITTKEIVVTDTGWADHVFKEEYSLLPLDDLERYIKMNNHLPGIPSEEEVQKTGANVGQVQVKLLEKIEELTLHVIDLNKRLVEQQMLLSELRRKTGQ